jgi:hypothetical protein
VLRPLLQHDVPVNDAVRQVLAVLPEGFSAVARAPSLLQQPLGEDDEALVPVGELDGDEQAQEKEELEQQEVSPVQPDNYIARAIRELNESLEDESSTWTKFVPNAGAPKTVHQLADETVSVGIARATLSRLATGYKKRSGSVRTEKGHSLYVKPATTNDKGCWLAGANPDSKGDGYVAVRPLVAASGTRSAKGTRAPKRAEQYVHRLAIKAWKGETEVKRMYQGGTANEVSHRCDEPSCFNPDHLLIEDHGANEKRKHTLHGTECHCDPSCILG